MMKLKMLVVAAGVMAMPALGHAQDMSKDSMKMKGDTMMMMKGDSMMKHDDSMMKGDASMKMSKMKMSKMKSMSARKGKMAKMDSDDMKAGSGMMSKGGDCPRGCPTSKGAAGLTGPQFLALQQELRDRGCGNEHVTGLLDSPTRRAIAACAKKMSVANNAGAVLVAMNIGYGEADVSMKKM